MDHKPPFNSKSPSEEVPAQGRNPSEHYISPDDGLPDKQLSIFDRSSLDQTQTNVQKHNSLYYLEHQNSQLMGFYNNWQAPSPYKGNPGQFDRSGLGLNQTNTMLGGNTVLNITNLTRNTQFQRLQHENDQSYLRRYLDPPSQSRIIQFNDEEMQNRSVTEQSSMLRDEEVSRMFQDKFNKSIMDGSREKRGVGDRSMVAAAQLADRSALLPAKDKSVLHRLP